VKIISGAIDTPKATAMLQLIERGYGRRTPGNREGRYLIASLPKTTEAMVTE